MSRLYANLGNLAPTYRLAVLAAFALVAWLAAGESIAWAECGDYVKVANPQFGGQAADHASHTAGAMPAEHGRDSIPRVPCNGPTCGRGAPALPLAPPVVVRTIVDQWAVLAAGADETSPAGYTPLDYRNERPLAGYRSLLKRPPRA